MSIVDEVPFDIPDTWEWARLGSISTYAESKQKINAQHALPDTWGLDLEDIEKGGRILQRITVGQRGAKGDKTAFHTGDILYSKLRPYLLKILVAPDEGVCTSEIVPFRVFGNIVPDYIVSYLKSPYVNGLINSVTYGVKMPRVGTETMTSLLVPIPPVNEQRRIMDRLSIVAPLIDRYEETYHQEETLTASFPEQLRKSILQLAVQGKLVPQNPYDEPASVLLERIRAEKERLIAAGKIKRDKHESVIFRRDNSHYEKQNGEELCIDDEIPFDIPDTWAWCRLREVLLRASTGPFGTMLHKDDYSADGVPLVNPANIVNQAISIKSIKYVSAATADRLSSYILHSGDVIIGRRGEMGRSAVVQTINDGWLCGTGCFFVKTQVSLLPEYLVFLLASAYLQSVLMNQSIGTTMNNLNHSILSELLIPLPPVGEQKRIMDSYCEITRLLPS